MTVNAISSSAPAARTNPTSSLEQSGLNADTFLKLLVAQLRYQDPSKPTDSASLLQQSAQYTLVEKLNDLAAQNGALLDAQQMATATSYLGRSVTALDASGATVTGIATTVRSSPTGPVLVVAGKELPLGAVRSVSQ